MCEVRDLKPNGANILVTEENKKEYVHLVCQMKMTGEFILYSVLNSNLGRGCSRLSAEKSLYPGKTLGGTMVILYFILKEIS